MSALDKEIEYGVLAMQQHRAVACVLRHLSTVAVAAVAAALVTSCGATEPPSARGLAARVSGCARITAQKPTQTELHNVTCIFTGSPNVLVDIAPGCCVQGSLWAATVDFNTIKAGVGYWSALDPTAVDFDVIIASIGGRQVNSPAVSH